MAGLTPPLKWHGGKHYLAGRIVALMPPHRVYVEPYAGGLAVLLRRDPDDPRLWAGASSADRGVIEIVNDLDGRLTNFWRVLGDEGLFARLLRRAQATPFAEAAWRAAAAHTYGADPAADAWAFFVHCRQSLAGRMDCFAPLSTGRTRRGMCEQSSAWLNAVEGLPAVHRRLRRVAVLNRDGLDVLRRYDGPDTFGYLDPTYPGEARAAPDVYRHEMTDAQHEALLDALAGIQGKFILSGYHNDRYDRAAARHGWRCVAVELANHAAGGAAKRRMLECLWMNYDPPAAGG